MKRRYTVTNRNRENGPVPELRMSGRWLAQAGFAPGSRLAIVVEHGRLVVTITARPRPLPCRKVKTYG
jgi:toxic protein SymE